MAKVTNAFDTYSATADREDLSNIILQHLSYANTFYVINRQKKY